ncbi:MAG: glycosyltransferase family 1 protein [Patescibacteria group bacterium]|nr:MAG: glycosyltransferase family 1 protein [Patescibacteria group bacterium]
MRIGIDARFFGPVGKGLGRYTERLIENLERIESQHEFVVFLRKENFDLYHPTSARFRKVLADFPWYSLSEQVHFPPLIRREGIDLMHFPHFNVPILTPCPFVVTIHDLILFRYPTRRATTLNAVMYRLKYAAYHLTIRLAARRAKRIIAVSEYTKRDITQSLGVPERKITVTYEASDAVQANGGAQIDLTNKKIVKPYFLYVGNAYPHKNLERLLDVFKRMRAGGLEAQLVLVGKMDYFYDRLKKEAERLGLLERNDAVFYGYATESELAELYRNARVYVFPSLLEGFGLPPLEAMRYGTPVAASDSSCLPEVLGDAATYFDPENPDAMAEAMQRSFADNALRATLAERGRAQAEKYTWKDCAERTYQAYLSSLPS